MSQLPPIFSGGAFKITKNEELSFGMFDEKIKVYSFIHKKLIPLKFNSEQEQIITFALSPNEKLLATSSKNYMIRIFSLPSLQNLKHSEEVPC